MVLRCEEPVDVVFMVDGSDSVSANDWTKVLKWTSNLIDSIAPQNREEREIYHQVVRGTSNLCDRNKLAKLLSYLTISLVNNLSARKCSAICDN